MEIKINISNEDYSTLKRLAICDSVETQIKTAIKVYLVNWIQYIPYINKHQSYIIPLEANLEYQLKNKN